MKITLIQYKVATTPEPRVFQGEGSLMGFIPIRMHLVEQVQSTWGPWQDLETDVCSWRGRAIYRAVYESAEKPEVLELMEHALNLKASDYKKNFQVGMWCVFGVFPTTWDPVTKQGIASVDHVVLGSLGGDRG